MELNIFDFATTLLSAECFLRILDVTSVYSMEAVYQCSTVSRIYRAKEAMSSSYEDSNHLYSITVTCDRVHFFKTSSIVSKEL